MKKGGLYTIGYARLTPARLVEVMDLLGIARLIDVRSVPRTRVAGFGPKQLTTLLGARYVWEGETLGGRAPIEERSLGLLAQRAQVSRLLLMCMEEAPGECHRHHDIALPLARHGVQGLHVYQDHVVAARALQATIDAGKDDYDCDPLRAHAARA